HDRAPSKYAKPGEKEQKNANPDRATKSKTPARKSDRGFLHLGGMWGEESLHSESQMLARALHL
ncbi:hypothetical protein, partial [Roseibium polysiphoniae]|uniref:hypothetical protein n=1 Tax=Roseibium polysiphoniae TaxID=2571221 RepID=UPI00329A79FB